MVKPLLRHPLFKFFASLKLAVTSILLLAAVLAWATVYESLYGMRAVHVMFYGTPWFAGLLLLLGINVLCAALSRYPWKRSQTGFVITHGGILILLFGSFLTQRFGVDGNLAVREGERGNEVILNDLFVHLLDTEGRKINEFQVPESALRKTGEILQIDVNGDKLMVEEFLPRAVYDRKVVPSPIAGVGLPAVRVELFNSRFQLGEWLEIRHPNEAAEKNLGPAVLRFRKFWSEQEEKHFFKERQAPKASGLGFLVAEFQGKQFRLDIAEAQAGWRGIGSTPYEIKVERYYSYAVVDQGQLVNKSKEPVNPAVQLWLRDKKSGVREKHTLFAHFPEFATLHKASLSDGQKPLPVRLEMVAAAQGQGQGVGRGELSFAQSSDGKRLLYLAKGKNGEVKSKGEVKVGEELITGWMDLRFRIAEWFPYATEEEIPRYVEQLTGGDSNFLTAIRVRVQRARGTASSRGSWWIVEGQSRPISIGGRDYYVGLGKQRLELPFFIGLEKFTIGHDPGTTKAASYESRVTVHDEASSKKPSALISMNEPLKYGGFTFYQASYQIEEGKPPVSVFSVNRDPGRAVKYLGSLVMVIGITLMFWMNPHYWDKILGRRRKEAA